MQHEKRDTRADRVVFGLSSLGLSDAAIGKYIGRSRGVVGNRRHRILFWLFCKFSWMANKGGIPRQVLYEQFRRGNDVPT